MIFKCFKMTSCTSFLFSLLDKNVKCTLEVTIHKRTQRKSVTGSHRSAELCSPGEPEESHLETTATVLK